MELTDRQKLMEKEADHFMALIDPTQMAKVGKALLLADSGFYQALDKKTCHELIDRATSQADDEERQRKEEAVEEKKAAKE